jgi:hypothetical protein
MVKFFVLKRKFHLVRKCEYILLYFSVQHTAHYRYLRAARLASSTFTIPNSEPTLQRVAAHGSKPLQRHSRPLNEIDYLDALFVPIINFRCGSFCYGQRSSQSVRRTDARTHTMDSLFLPDQKLVTNLAPVAVAAQSKA